MSMKVHTTNYSETFIQVAEDCPAASGVVPPERGGKSTVAGLLHKMITQKPYTHTSDDVIFATSAVGRALTATASLSERQQARRDFFSKGQACLRASALSKQFGWGVHSDSNGRIAIFSVDSPDYRKLASDKGLKQVRAMRLKKS